MTQVPNELDSTPSTPLFIVTVDAEEEWDWSKGLPRPPFSTKNIRRIPAFQSFCDEIGLTPTYFVDAAVVADDANRKIFTTYLDRGECDIGAQLHPWCTAPIDELRSDFNSHSINLDSALVRAKLKSLTESLESAFGQHPFSFRCGRWGMNGNLMRMLSENGYLVDSSVRPRYRTEYFNYHDAAQGRPYWPCFENICQSGSQRKILEIPVSDGFSRVDFDQQEQIHSLLGRMPLSILRLRGIVWHLGALRKILMTPEGMNAADLCRCIDMHIRRGNRVITLFMHSSDLLPGGTPYVRSEQDLTRFLDTLRQAALHAQKVHGARFVTVREAHALLTGQNCS